MALTGDGHVHTDWSWDTGVPSSNASMDAMCRRAAHVGLPALAFTEHLDVGSWEIEPQDYPERLRPLIKNGQLEPPPLDAEGYLADVERCRALFPGLMILTGVELGQPHLDADRVRQVVDLDVLDRVNGSLHTIPVTDQPAAARAEPYTLYRLWPADDVVRAYLTELLFMIKTGGTFEVVCHVDYVIRGWPSEAEGPFDPTWFEAEYREVLQAIARSGRVLEVNLAGPARAWIVQWWREEGGRTITLGSDAHTTDRLAADFYEAMAMVEHFGFHPGRRPQDPWMA